MGMERTIGFLNETFAGFYRDNPLPPPVGFERREFGFMYHGQTFFRRHLGFASPPQLHRDMLNRPPAHVYHSAAYYERPDAHTMNDKGWLGADLIFDLDADHLEGAEKMTYSEMLLGVKSKFRTLVNGFLLGELGYDESDLLLVFSGSRGYHAHIRDPRVRSLNSVARRQLVDYITKNVPIDTFVELRSVDKVGYRTVKSVRIPSASEGGWRGRLTTATVSQLREIAGSQSSIDDKVARLVSEVGIGVKEAKAVMRGLSGPERNVKDRLARLEDGIGDIFEGIGPATFEHLFSHHLNVLKGWCDEPVSSDIKRLIRAPGSLHGKTGLRATTFQWPDFDDFDPLVKAAVLDDEPVPVTASPGAKPFTLKGQEFTPAPGPMTLPRFAAVFLILRRQALLEGDTPPAPPPATPAADAASKPG